MNHLNRIIFSTLMVSSLLLASESAQAADRLIRTYYSGQCQLNEGSGLSRFGRILVGLFMRDDGSTYTRALDCVGF